MKRKVLLNMLLISMSLLGQANEKYLFPNIGDIVINELMYDNSDLTEEYIELLNLSNDTLDLSGIMFTTRKTDGTLNYGANIPTNTLIFPHTCLAFTKNPTADSLYYNCNSDSHFKKMGSWKTLSNNGTSIVLCTTNGDTVYDELAYTPVWHHPLINNEKNVSLERIDPYGDTQNPANWHSASSSVNYGTPGYENSQYLGTIFKENAQEFWLEEKYFSPNNDGADDLLLIHYGFEQSGWITNIRIFDAGGRLIKSLYENHLLSTKGVLTWDGRLNNNALADIGAYLIFIESFNTALGRTQKDKIVCAVNGK